MYFDFDDSRPDIRPVGSVVSWRGGVLLSTAVHLAVAGLLLSVPRLVPTALQPALIQASTDEQPQQEARFVFVEPRVDLEALRALERAPLSDKDRLARAPESEPKPSNPLPLLRGNTAERVESVEAEAARGRGPEPEPSVEPRVEDAPKPSESANQQKLPESQSALLLPPSRPGAPQNRAIPGGALGDALRNLQRYVQPNQFDNTQGGAQFGAIQFDTKGVEFGPWVKRFAAQVKRNWDPLIPIGPLMMRMQGHVVITLNVHKNGSITDVTVVDPCAVDGFNTAAFGSLVASNPTQPLPPEYPADKAFFTINFFYNERPPD